MSSDRTVEHPRTVSAGTGLDQPSSLLLVRVFADRIEVSEQVSDKRTAELLASLRRLGVHGKVSFQTPCG